MIARSNHHRIDIFVVEQLAKIRILFSAAVFFSRALKMLLIRIAQCGDPDVAQRAELLEQLIAAAAGSNETEIQLLVLALRAYLPGGQSQADRGGRLQ